MEKLNALDGFKIACDIPSGLHPSGMPDSYTFRADLTVTMGGLKRSLYSDAAKEVCGEILTCDLGIGRSFYEIPSAWQLLEKSDLSLPLRTRASAHKGSSAISPSSAAKNGGGGHRRFDRPALRYEL